MAEIGGTTGRGLAGEETKDADQLGSIAIELIDADLRPYSVVRVRGRPAGRRAAPPDAGDASASAAGAAGRAAMRIDIQLSGADAETLKAAAEA